MTIYHVKYALHFIEGHKFSNKNARQCKGCVCVAVVLTNGLTQFQRAFDDMKLHGTSY